jgi:hypothetical protein
MGACAAVREAERSPTGIEGQLDRRVVDQA